MKHLSGAFLLLGLCCGCHADSGALEGQSSTPPSTVRTVQNGKFNIQDSRDACDKLRGRISTLLSAILPAEIDDRAPPVWIRAHLLLGFGPNGYGERHRSRAAERLYSSFLTPNASEFGSPFAAGRLSRHGVETVGVEREQHLNQFLAYLAMAGTPPSAPVLVDGEMTTIASLVKKSREQVHLETQLAWTVIAYAHYLPLTEHWKTKFEEPMSCAQVLERLLQREEPACDGAHYYTALALAVSRWGAMSDASTRSMLDTASLRLSEKCTVLRNTQRPDGSLLCPSIKGDGPDGNVLPVMFGSGHHLEWLTISLSEEELQSKWMLDLVTAVLNATEQHQRSSALVAPDYSAQAIEYGALGHALSSLHRWSLRVEPGR